MAATGVKERFFDMWRWRSSRSLLVAALVITAIVSVFNIRLDPLAMLLEVVSNFITCTTITATTATTFAVFGDTGRVRQRWRGVLLLSALVVSGMAGGMIAWGLNDLVFDYHITHPHIYLLIVAVLSLIFGMSVLAYRNLSERLEKTAARLAEQEVREQTLQRLKTEARLEALRAKVDPHFLFNTLNSIASLIPESPGAAEELVQRLSNLFHHTLSHSDHEFVSLGEELEFVREYLEIEKVRLGDRLDYTIEMDPALDGTAIPAMILQPLVENGVKYGVAPLAGGGKIGVRCVRKNRRCRITITDTGEGFDAGDRREGFGIAGVRQRLELHYGDDHRFDIEPRGGVTITIGIPIDDEVPDRTG